MRYVKLDSVIKGFCTEVNDTWLHRYGEYYKLIHGWLVKSHDGRLGGPLRIVRAPVDGRRVWIPRGMAVDKIGVNVDGSISVLLPNNNMLDLDDDCGVHSPPETGNPDTPVVNVGTADLRTGNTLWLNNWNGWSGNWFDYASYWPGQGGGKSIRGYYRVFHEKGYILLDSSCTYTEIILEGRVPTFTPYATTWVAQCAQEAMEAWCIHRSGHLAAQVSTMKRPMLSVNNADYSRTMKNLRSALNGEPLSAIVSAVHSRIGQIDIF